MNQLHTNLQHANAMTASDEISLADLLVEIAKRKRQLVLTPLAAAAVAAAVSFFLPNIYVASTRLLPPQQSQSAAAGLISQLGGMASLAAGVTGLKNPNDLYVAMLRSRTIADKLIAKFDLKKVYGLDSQEKARKELEDNSTITAGKDGLITIDVEARDQMLVAKLANAYVSELVDLTKVLAVSDASQRRAFYERQLEAAKNNLAQAEMSLKAGLDQHGVISVDSESRAIVETIGRLRAQASAKEVQLRSMEAFVTTSNPAYRRAQEELASLRSELSKLENGRSDAAAAPVAAAGKDGLANIKTLRDVKYYQMLYEILAKQYEVARLDEAKDPTSIQVLDPAVDPEHKYKPKRAIIVLGAAIGAFFATLLWIAVSTIRQKALAAQGRVFGRSAVNGDLGSKQERAVDANS